MDDYWFVKPTEEAIKRMERAAKRGTGCRLTPEMIDALSVTILSGLGEYAEEERA